jgi:arsenite-transporting ATPase
VLLLAGKGGAGTTTVAAATALTAAHAGIKTLLLSTETPSLSDVLGVPTAALESAGRGRRPGPVEVESGLEVLQPDSSVPADALHIDVGHVLDAAGVQGLPAADLLGLTGLTELTSLCSVCEQVADGPWDLVVADIAGGDRALRLLSAPDDAVRALDRLAAPQRRLGLARLGLGALVGRSLGRLRADLEGMRELLHAPTSSVRLVVAAESAGLAWARRAFTSLVVQGFVVDGVVANRVLGPGADPTAWASSRAAAQSHVLAQADEAFAPVAVQRLPDLPAAPVWPDAVARLGAALMVGLAAEVGSSDPAVGLERLLVPPVGARQQVRRVADGYELVIPAPLLSARDVQLTRDGDELRLGVQGTWWVLALPAVLRRCIAVDAQLGGGSLVVRFRPDPELWPARPGAETSAAEGEA